MIELKLIELCEGSNRQWVHSFMYPTEEERSAVQLLQFIDRQINTNGAFLLVGVEITVDGMLITTQDVPDTIGDRPALRNNG